MIQFDTILEFTEFFVGLLLQFFQSKNLQKGGDFFNFLVNLGKGQLDYEKERIDKNAKKVAEIGNMFQKFNTDLNQTLNESLIKTLDDLRIYIFGNYYDVINIQSFNLLKYIKQIYITVDDNSSKSLKAHREAVFFVETIITNLSNDTSDLNNFSISSSVKSIKDGGNKKNMKKKIGGEVISSLILLAILSLIHSILRRELDNFTDKLMTEIFTNKEAKKNSRENSPIIFGGNTKKYKIKFKNI